MKRLLALCSLMMIVLMLLLGTVRVIGKAAGKQCVQVKTYTSENDGKTYIADFPRTVTIHNADDSNDIFPGEPPYPYGYQLSPDGSQAAYLTRSSQQDFTTLVLESTNAAAHQSRKLELNTPSRYVGVLNWSVDGYYLHAGTSDDTHFIISVEPLQVVKEFQSSSFNWLPKDHRYSYVVSDNADDPGILNVSSPERQSIEKRISLNHVSTYQWWSPGERYVAVGYMAVDAARRVDIDIYASDGSFISNLQGPPVRYNEDRFEQNWSPTIGWTADSQALLYAQVDRYADLHGDTHTPVKLLAFMVDSHTTQTLSDQAVWDNYGIYSYLNPHTNQLAFKAWQNQDRMAAVWMDSSGANSHTLVEDAMLIDGLSWSPDGQYIAAVKVVAGRPISNHYDLYDIEGTPDADSLESRLVWAKSDGSDQHELLYRRARIVQWLPERNSLVFVAQEGKDPIKLWAVNLETGERTLWANNVRDEAYDSTGGNTIWRFYPSPDNTHMAISYYVAYGDGGPGPAGVYVTNMDGTKRQRLPYGVHLSDVLWTGSVLSYQLEDEGMSTASLYQYQEEHLVRVKLPIYAYRAMTQTDCEADS